MQSLNYDNIVFSAETKILDLAEELCGTNKRLKQEALIDEATAILYLLEAVTTYEAYMDDDEVNVTLECLKDKADLFAFPITPIINELTAPIINVGPQGPQGVQGDRGADGGGTDFIAPSVAIDTIVDSFGYSEAYGARWDVLINGTSQRVSTILATWTEDGTSIIDTGEIGTTDLNGSTSGISLSVTIVGSDVRLTALITSGTWTISGSRYFVPNNGSYTPVTSSLASGKIFIGSAANLATPQTVSGDISLSLTGVTAIGTGVIVNADVNAAAALDVSKFAALTASKGVVTNSSGVLTTSAATATEVGYLAGVTSSIQTQLDSKLSAASGAISTVVSTNLTADRAVISNPSGKIAVSSITTTELGYLGGVTSNLQTQLGGKVDDTGDVITGPLEIQGGIRTTTTGSYLKIKVVNIGDWDMDSTTSVSVAHGIADFTKIRRYHAIIQDDAGAAAAYYPLDFLEVSSPTTPLLNGGYTGVSGTTVGLFRRQGGFFDSTNYNAVSFNRGFITIIYEA